MRTYGKGTFELKKISLLAVLILQAVLLLTIQAWFPFYIGVPGVKPGLVNIIIVPALVFFSLSETMTLILVSSVLSFFICGGPISFIFSLSGGILSAVAMGVVLKAMHKWLSLIGVSVIGAIAHNISGALTACFIMTGLSAVGYMKELVFTGILIGCLVGICSTILVRTMKRFNLISNF